MQSSTIEVYISNYFQSSNENKIETMEEKYHLCSDIRQK